MRNEINIVIPVKDPAGAKSRLDEVLSMEQRAELARVLFDEVLRFFRELPDPPHLLVVTDAEEVAEQARAHGAAVLLEEEPQGETAAVERAAAWSADHGFASQLVIPGDMAGLDRDEVLRLLDHPRHHPSVILCPATGDDGTNAILCTPPNAISYRFGDRSFPDYQQRAREAGVHVDILRLPSLVLDLDTPEDLWMFLRQEHRHPAHELLAQWKILQEQ